MNTSPQEEEDASRVDEALIAIQNGLNDGAFLILREVVRNTPETYTGVVKATALRGKGMALIELGDLDLAETTLKESLYYDPDNKLARNELGYIQHLRAGNVPSPVEPVSYKPTKPTTCKKCGKEFKQGQVLKQGGALIYLCDECFPFPRNSSNARLSWSAWVQFRPCGAPSSTTSRLPSLGLC